MKLVAYGEDALTLWAIKNKVPLILKQLNDSSSPSRCQIFFRPSFGRSGGDKSAQFGEFDFIILAEQRLYLGESKWDKSSEKIQDRILNLRYEQLLRHNLLKFYIEEWAFGDYGSWVEFEQEGSQKLQLKGITKPIAPARSQLATNLQTVLRIIREQYITLPEIVNILLYLHNQVSPDQLPQQAGEDFQVVSIDYSESVIDNFITISL